MPKWMNVKFSPKHIGKSGYTAFVVWISDIEDAPIALVVLVFDNPEEAFDAVPEVGKTTFLPAAVHQADRSSFHQIQDELGDHA